MTTVRIVSYSLFGANPAYAQGALENCALVRDVLPGWTCRVHVSNRITPEVRDDLAHAGAEVVVVEQQDAYDGLYWRFLPAADPAVDAVIIRDADARLGAREASAVAEWLDSGKPLHIMRDHPAHRRLIPAGLWGARGGAVPDMAELIAGFGREHGFASRTGDADFLERLIYPRFRGKMFVHSGFSYYPGEEPHLIPMARDGLDYLGRPAGRDEELEKRVKGLARNMGQGQVLRPLPEWMTP